MDITTVEELERAPYRIQSMRSHYYGGEFETNKAYPTMTAAIKAAEAQACNVSNKRKGNRFIVYKAMAVVGPRPLVPPPMEVIVLGENNENG